MTWSCRNFKKNRWNGEDDFAWHGFNDSIFNDSQAEHRVKIQAALQARTREIRTVMEQKTRFYGFSRVFVDIETFSSKHG